MADEISHKDFFGTELKIGDTVAIMRPQYRDLVKGEVIAFTPQKVRVKYQVHWAKDQYDETLTYPCDVVKKP